MKVKMERRNLKPTREKSAEPKGLENEIGGKHRKWHLKVSKFGSEVLAKSWKLNQEQNAGKGCRMFRGIY